MAVEKRKVGRPSKMTPKVKEKVIEILSLGMSMGKAALIVGVDVTTIENAMHADPDFSAGIKGAEAKGELFCLQGIRDRVERWQSLAWFLERRHGRVYGQKVTLNDSQEVSLKLVREIVQSNGNVNGTAKPDNPPLEIAPAAGRIS